MSKLANTVAYTIMTLAIIASSACSTKQEPAPIAAPAPVEAVTEKSITPEVVPEPVPNTVTSAEQPPVNTQEAPRKVIKKTKKLAKPAPIKVAAPEPAPVVEQKAAPVLQPEPTPPAVIAPPAKEEPGFFEQYWLWLVALLVLIVGIFVWIYKARE